MGIHILDSVRSELVGAFANGIRSISSDCKPRRDGGALRLSSGKAEQAERACRAKWARRGLLRSTGHSAIQTPINAVVQLADKGLGTNMLPKVQIRGLEARMQQSMELEIIGRNRAETQSECCCLFWRR